MKNILVVTLLLTCLLGACSTKLENKVVKAKSTVSSPITTQEAFLEQTDSHVRMVSETTKLMETGPTTTKIQATLQTVPSHLRTNLPGLKGKTVHIILQNHGSMDNSSIVPESETRFSQNKIASLLPKLKPTVIGIEGFLSDRLRTKNDILAEVTGEGLFPEQADLSFKMTEQERETGYMSILFRSSALKYAMANKDCHAFGAENFGLINLTLMFMQSEAPAVAQQQIGYLQRLRGIYMLSRTSELMTKNNAGEGAMIIGSFHKNDFDKIPELFGANLVFHDTTN